jgi:hypothetical protein
VPPQIVPCSAFCDERLGAPQFKPELEHCFVQVMQFSCCFMSSAFVWVREELAGEDRLAITTVLLLQDNPRVRRDEYLYSCIRFCSLF